MVQFVPLKVETAGEPWQKWARQYPPEGNGIPIIYIIRADGTKLYGKSGPVPGENLGPFLATHLATAGRVLNDAEAKLLTEAVAAANQAIADGDTFNAVKSLCGTKRIGPLGNVGSFAKVAAEADRLIKQFNEEGKARLEEIRTNLTSGSGSFDDVLALAETKRNYQMLPALKVDLTVVAREVNKDAALRGMLRPAEVLDRALALLTLPNYRSRGIAGLKQVVTRYPGTPAEKIARKKLQELDVPLVAAGTSTPPGAAVSPDVSPDVAKKRASSYLRIATVFSAERPEKAREYAQKVIDLVPGSEQARQAQELIDGLK